MNYEDFDSFVEENQTRLARLGWALTGNQHLGEDLAQASLLRVWRRWEAVTAKGDPTAYVHRTMVNLSSSWRRRYFRYSELPRTDSSTTSFSTEESASIAERIDVDHWLRSIPARQRATLVLRFLLDLSVEETAECMSCSIGTVKSQTAKGLRAMRAEIRIEEVSKK